MNDMARPDIIVILTDEERATPAYESDDVRAWRHRTLTGRRWFDEHGVSFGRHYTGAVACVPSRPTLFTGHYPDVHGVTQTDGLGKQAGDTRMRWLPPHEVPTLGHWLRAAGYDTHYDGKWHLSHADLTDPDTGAPLATNTADGTVLDDAVATYLAANPLDDWGFSGWVGPEPHGADAANAGTVRDNLIAARVTAWLADRYDRRRAGDPEALRPFLCVASFVNPHDIVLFPGWVNNSPLGPDPWDTPAIAPAPTAGDDLADRPGVQAAYRHAYFTGYGPAAAIKALYDDNADAYRSLYYRLHAEVDGAIDTVRAAVCGQASPATTAGGTVLVRSSDHGDLLGAHGGLHQKWFTMYDEAVRVPMTIVHLAADGTPVTTGRSIDNVPTSHVDIVPTLIDVARASEQAMATELANTFTEVHPLPGTSLWPAVAASGSPQSPQSTRLAGDHVGSPDVNDPYRTVYLQTRDNILEGDGGESVIARVLGIEDPTPDLQIASVGLHPSNVEAVVGRVSDTQAPGGGDHLWKLVRTFDDPQCWTEPGVRNLATAGPDGVSWRTDPLPDEWELYDLTTDPGEAQNLAHDAIGDTGTAAVLHHLRARLDAERDRCLPQRNAAWPYRVSAAAGV
jgi:arylsulfatase A-like enzyme